MSAAADLQRVGVSRVLEPTEPAFADAVAGFDLGVACAPDAVVAAQTSADVASTVAVMARRGEPLAIVGSGHGRLSALQGGTAISLRAFTRVDVDVPGRRARIGAGCTWDPVLAATTPHGLAPVCGSAPGVGVIGYLLGGGLGPLAGAVGFSSDHVRSFEVVTPADGAVAVSQDAHPDLFWAMRGGKGGFGVVTAVTIDLLELDAVYGGGLYFDAADAHTVLAAYAEWAPALPEASTTSIALLRLPASDALPRAIRGRHVAHVRFASIDGAAAGGSRLADMRGVAEPLLDTVDVLPYARLGTIHGDPVAPMSVANGTASLAALDRDAVAAVLAAADLGSDRPLSSVEIRTLGPATRRPPERVDAVGGRSAAHLLNVYAAPVPSLSDDARLAVARNVLDAMRSWQAPVNLVNFVGRANSSDAVVNSWTAEQNARLDAIRARHDPGGQFPYAGHGA
jgi:FAD/FMN-containing dehydrogenase